MYGMIIITIIAAVVFLAFIPRSREMIVSMMAFGLTLPVKIGRAIGRGLTKNYKNKILGAIAVAENAKHPLEGKNVTGQCIAFYENYMFPAADDMINWLGPSPPKGLTIIHLRDNNIIVSVIDLTDKLLLTIKDEEYCFEPLAFESIDVDDLGGLTIYNCNSLISAMSECKQYLADDNSNENKEE